MRISCKICRRLGLSVCGREKCAFKRKPYPPGVHGRSRRRGGRGGGSEYGVQLREKQKLKFMYGLRETQFKNYVLEAERLGEARVKLMQILESRLDNTVFRLGLAPSRIMARQLVSHGHIMVNGRKVSIPSFRTKKNDVISVRPQSSSKGMFRDLEMYLKKYQTPPWLALDKDKREGKVLGSADIADPALEQNINLGAIVEFYSR
ncbi:30S ribosomal protein S4 [Candidatus Giovannonibacteria bacterium]|nr:30S ribosomal protein S4 [Candidatus Giovannonibacteria bacterium]